MIPASIQEDVKAAFQRHHTDEERVKMLFGLWWSTSGLDEHLQLYMVAALQLQRQELLDEIARLKRAGKVEPLKGRRAVMVQYIVEPFADAELAGWTGPGWYFWDETQSQCHGPYVTEEEARDQLRGYCDTYLKGPEPRE